MCIRDSIILLQVLTDTLIDLLCGMKLPQSVLCVLNLLRQLSLPLFFLRKDVYKRQVLGSMQGILVPGGFGSRGVEGKILAAKYARCV